MIAPRRIGSAPAGYDGLTIIEVVERDERDEYQPYQYRLSNGEHVWIAEEEADDDADRARLPLVPCGHLSCQREVDENGRPARCYGAEHLRATEEE